MGKIPAIAFLLLLVGCGPARPAGRALSRDLVGPPSSAAAIVVSSEAFSAGGRIDRRNSAYGANLSPALSWTPVAGARSYALVLEDPDAHAPRPWGHWLIWNIPADTVSLEAAVPLGAIPSRPAGAAQGRGDAGDVGYFGPRPPEGVHHYHFEVFALDRMLDVAPGSDRDALLAAMKDHVIASGDLVGAFAAPGG